MSAADSGISTILSSYNTNLPSDSSSSHAQDIPTGLLSLKRPASPDPDDQISSRKRMREDTDDVHGRQAGGDAPHTIDGHALAEDLAQELQCGCCAELVYKPVVVTPCDHFFCGSCCTLWVKNGGTNCPACRGVSSIVTPSRAVQSMVDVLLRAAPHRQRTERERMQADEIYPTSRAFRIPVPREPSPEPTIPTSTDFVQPCPHCTPNNPFNWTCPQPIPDPNTDADHAWHVNDGTPPGHGFCGNCEVLLALHAPSTSRCDFCQVSFCGINVQGRCVALGLSMQTPHGLTDLGDLIQSTEVYDCFDGNTVEVDFLLDYMTSHRLSPKHIYRQPLIEQDLFMDMHAVAGGIDSDPSAPRRSICRLCAAEIFLYGLRDWWVRERRKAVLDGTLADRKDCPEGRNCRNINDLINHIIVPLELEHEPAAPEMAAPQPETSTSSSLPNLVSVTDGYSFSNSNSSSPRRAGSALPPASSTTLPSIGDLGIPLGPFATLPLPASLTSHTIPLFLRVGANDDTVIAERSRLSPEEMQEAQEVVEAAPPDLPSQTQDKDAVEDIDVDEDEHAEPSSSQSRRAVEAHLDEAAFAGYETDPDHDSPSDAELEPGRDEDDLDAAACYAAAQAQAEAELPSVRRAASQSKMSVDFEYADHMPMDGVLSTPPVAGGLPSFSLSRLPEADPVARPYPVGVE
ncbi:hypothetical protein DFH11DRAFT_1599391 [Phellopilus nigrolimitatus]|nr:hypothetical protein DFH11DRAFT_1599391 [Phellopilus nigrolimitatus]